MSAISSAVGPGNPLVGNPQARNSLPATRAPNDEQKKTASAAAHVLLHPSATDENHSIAYNKLADTLIEIGGDKKITDVTAGLKKLGIPSEALIAKNDNGKPVIDIKAIGKLIDTKIESKQKAETEQKLATTLTEQKEHVKKIFLDFAVDPTSTERAADLNAAMKSYGFNNEDLKGIIDKHMAPSENQPGYEAVKKGMDDAFNKIAEPRTFSARLNPAHQEIIPLATDCQNLVKSIKTAKKNIAEHEAKIREMQSQLQVEDGGNDVDEGKFTDLRTKINAQTGMIGEENAKISEAETALAPLQRDLGKAMENHQVSAEDMKTLLADGGGFSNAVIPDILSSGSISEGRSIAKASNTLGNLSASDIRALDRAIRDYDPTTPETHKKLAKFMDKHDLTPQDLAHISDAKADPKLNDPQGQVVALREALKAEVIGQKSNEKVLDAAEEVINNPSPEALQELHAAMGKNDTKTEDLSKLLKKMGVSDDDIQKIDFKGLQELDNQRDLKKAEDKKGGFALFLKVAAGVAAIGLVVFGVATMAAGISMLLYPPAMPLGIALLGAGLAATLGGVAIGGGVFFSLHPNLGKKLLKEDAKYASLNQQEPAQRKEELDVSSSKNSAQPDSSPLNPEQLQKRIKDIKDDIQTIRNQPAPSGVEDASAEALLKKLTDELARLESEQKKP